MSPTAEDAPDFFPTRAPSGFLQSADCDSRQHPRGPKLTRPPHRSQRDLPDPFLHILGAAAITNFHWNHAKQTTDIKNNTVLGRRVSMITVPRSIPVALSSSSLT